MSKETVKAFYEALKTDAAMAEELAQKTAADAVDSVIQFAAEKGYAFTAEDIQAAEAEAQEISPDNLDNVNAAGSSLFGTCKLLGFGNQNLTNPYNCLCGFTMT